MGERTPVSGAAEALKDGTVRRSSKRHPRLDQSKRTWYLLRKNTLAMIGLALLILFASVFIVSYFYPAPNDSMVTYCGTYADGIQHYPNSAVGSGCSAVVCTYPVGTPPPAAGCYSTDPNNPSFVGPTATLSSLGPLPFGSLATDPSSPVMYSLFQGIVKGSEWSVPISLSVVSIAATLGVFLGSLAGVAGGRLDEVIMRITDIFLSIPSLLLVLVLVTVLATDPAFGTLSGRIFVLILGFAITLWPLYTRIVRSQVIVVREQKFVEAARASGARTGRILRRHIIPNSLYPVFVQFALDVGAIPLFIGTIIFLNIHVWPATQFPEWGTIAANGVSTTVVSNLLFSGSSYFPWWQLLFPGLVLFLFAISVNFLSDGLRDALDPRLRR